MSSEAVHFTFDSLWPFCYPEKANELIDRCIHFYNHERIQNKTGVAPLTLRHSA